MRRCWTRRRTERKGRPQVLLGDLKFPLFGALLKQSSSTCLGWQGRLPWGQDVLDTRRHALGVLLLELLNVKSPTHAPL